jgi:hypothetical protein
MWYFGCFPELFSSLDIGSMLELLLSGNAMTFNDL